MSFWLDFALDNAVFLKFPEKPCKINHFCVKLACRRTGLYAIKVRRQVQNLMASVAVAKLVTWYGCVIRVLTSRATATDFEGYSRLIEIHPVRWTVVATYLTG